VRHGARVPVVYDLRIDEEAHREFHGFTGLQKLLGEAEALQLVEVDGGDLGKHVVDGRPAHRLVGGVGGTEEGKIVLADLDLHRVLHGLEVPGQARRHVAIEADGNGLIEDGR
jgi:hypothetical protein